MPGVTAMMVTARHMLESHTPPMLKCGEPPPLRQVVGAQDNLSGHPAGRRSGAARGFCTTNCVRHCPHPGKGFALRPHKETGRAMRGFSTDSASRSRASRCPKQVGTRSAHHVPPEDVDVETKQRKTPSVGRKRAGTAHFSWGSRGGNWILLFARKPHWERTF
jgi:hypothetical protein